jgi:succinate dehydrogenase flavin-adding protein (antitoxin of CptAB toxin-antitoxin module)
LAVCHKRRRWKHVEPRKDKGSFFFLAQGEAIMLQAEDGLTHFRWASRPEGIVELDLILFEGDAAWKRVGKVHDGRVFYLDWINGDQKEFFWMQGADDSKDDDVFERINKVLKAPAGK